MLETLVLPLALAYAALPPEAPAPARSPLEVTTLLFEAISADDRRFLDAHVDPAGSIAVIMARDGQALLRHATLADYLAVDPDAAPFSEELHDAREIVGERFATVVGRYSYRINGRLHHCGEVAAGLRRAGDRWIIGTLQYSVETDCAEQAAAPGAHR